MPEPRLQYLTGHPPAAVDPQSPHWQTPLPMNRPALDLSPTIGPTLGQYFAAAGNYLKANEFAAIRKALSRQPSPEVMFREITRVAIHLVKHGALYHPAQITVVAGTDTRQLVLNVAASEQGRCTLPTEYSNLEKLNRVYPVGFLPQVYHCGEGRSDDGVAWPMFLGQWLTGYCECHLSLDNAGIQHWQVWDDVQGIWELTLQQVGDWYRQAAKILAFYLQPLTFESILDWHPAAGDFVVKPFGEGIDVCLISVRRYATIIQTEADNTRSVAEHLEIMLQFLLLTSMRLRLDRLDGVGELIWAEDFVLPSIWEGLLEGLMAAAARFDLPREFVLAIADFFSIHTHEDLMRIGKEILDQRAMGVPETSLVRGHLDEHISGLQIIARQGLPKDRMA